MTRREHRYGYRRVDAAMIRAVARADETALPPWPVPRDGRAAPLESWQGWLAAAWADPREAEAVQVASPTLAAAIEATLRGSPTEARRARRAAQSLCRYLIRSGCRSTPFGMFAGIAPASFGVSTDARFGRADRIIVHPGPQWLEAAITALEQHGELPAGVEVCVSNLCRATAGRVETCASGDADVSLRLTPAVALVIETASSPVRYDELAGKLAAEFPAAAPVRILSLLADLLRHRVLVSALRAPATTPDAAGHLLDVLDQARNGEAADDQLARALRAARAVAADLADESSSAVRRALRQRAQEAMRAAIPDQEARLDVHLRLDARVTLPTAVAEVMETAADLLARVAAYPIGTRAWREYAGRFADRYGEGTLVGVTELTDPKAGLGFPPGFLSPDAGLGLPARDRRLLDIAGRAAMDGATRLELSDSLVASLEEAAGRPRRPNWPPHLEVAAQVLASSPELLDRGDFRVLVQTASRGAGTMNGRFLPLLDHGDQRRMAGAYASIPAAEWGAVVAQLSFASAKAAVDPLTRTIAILPRVIAIGECRRSAEGVIGLEDLAVGIRGGQLFLRQRSTGRLVEPLAPTALNFRRGVYVPPLARFLAEISRSGKCQVTGFDWGGAGWLPFTPALHTGRIILTPARWRLSRPELPGRKASLAEWSERLQEWRGRRRAPERVLLTEGDQHLALDLGQDAHLDLLRAAVDKAGSAVLSDAPPADGFGWIGGRAHSLVMPMTLHAPARERR
jgi:lantibiotic biosynthesis protein